MELQRISHRQGERERTLVPYLHHSHPPSLSYLPPPLTPSHHPSTLPPSLPHSVYTMQLMLECKHFVAEKILPPEKRKSLNYTELGRQAMGAVGKWAVDVSVLGCNLGVAAGYMIFIASNLHVRAVICI